MQLRATFDTVAELYDRAWPGYPPQLFDDLEALAGLRRGARVLEIGCGTGVATVRLAERGYRVTCVELGAQLAAVARPKLASFADVDVVVADFETWDGPVDAFDAVTAFTAFHWLSDEARFAKPAALLRPGGALAVVATDHVLPPNGDRFFVEVQEDYDAVVPDPSNAPPGPPEAIGDLSEDIDASGVFTSVGTRRYQWDVVSTAGAYIDVLNTYSGHRALDDATRGRLLDRIRRRIDDRGGSVRKTYLTTLNVARRL